MSKRLLLIDGNSIMNRAFYGIMGNKMLSSDFKICIMYAYTSVQAGIENVKINIDSVEDEEFKREMIKKYEKIIIQAKELYSL